MFISFKRYNDCINSKSKYIIVNFDTIHSFNDRQNEEKCCFFRLCAKCS